LQDEVELGSGDKAVGIEDGNYETVTTRMQPSVIVWDLETVPHERPRGCGAAKQRGCTRLPQHRLNSKGGNLLPQRQHLLLVSGVAVCLNERTRSDGEPLSLTSSHVLHLNGDDSRHIPNPTFFYIQRQNSNGSIVLPS
jgi:hypothetical protein